MNKLIAILSATLLMQLAGAMSVKADNPTPYKLPSAHNEAIENSMVMEPSFESIREFSPFAQAEINQNTNETLINELTEFAAKYLGTRYRRGSASPKGFDCSGFVGFIYKHFGINLGRSSSSQYKELNEKVDRNDLRPGDLMFFSGRAGNRNNVGHVAMVVDVNPDGSCTFIHASSSKGVTYQKFPDGGYYSKRYIGAKRVIPTDPEA